MRDPAEVTREHLQVQACQRMLGGTAAPEATLELSKQLVGQGRGASEVPPAKNGLV